jgi:8-hydroxy-5-deazaflavin:NADPH oxidoreductase
MNIGILGAGRMTNALGRRFVKSGHRLVVSYSRDPARLEKTATDLGGGTRAASAEEAARFGDVVLLSVGWNGAAAALKAAGSLAGKTLWSIVTPLRPDLSGLVVGTTTSGSEELAKVVPGAAFVAGWPPFADVLASPSAPFGPDRPTLFYCGDDADAKATVLPLLKALDVDPVDAGPLRTARFIEPSMFLLVHLAYEQHMGSVGTRLLRG